MKILNDIILKWRWGFQYKDGKIIATNESIKTIVKVEILRLGKNADLNHIDVSKVTTMKSLFKDSEFNGDISRWNVGNVRDMSCMFYNSHFNGDISRWDVSNVQDMGFMFYYSYFNGDISRWNVSNVNDMKWMFYQSTFNGDISDWNVRNVRDMSYMFGISPFNGDISRWNVWNLKDMSYMFYNSSFKGDLNKWNPFNLTSIVNAFTHSDLVRESSNLNKRWGIPWWWYFIQIIECREILLDSFEWNWIVTTKNLLNITKIDETKSFAEIEKTYGYIIIPRIQKILKKIDKQNHTLPVIKGFEYVMSLDQIKLKEYEFIHWD